MKTRSCIQYAPKCLCSDRIFPLSGSVGSHHVYRLASPSPMSPHFYSLHKSIFVIAWCLEQTDTVLRWSSCRPRSPDHQLTICLLYVSSFSSVLSLLPLLLSLSICFISFFLSLLLFPAEWGQKAFKVNSGHAHQSLPPQNLREGEYFSSALMCRSTAGVTREAIGTQIGVFSTTLTGNFIITVTKWMNVNISATKSSNIHLQPSQNCPLHARERLNTWRLSLFRHMPWFKQRGTNIRINLCHLQQCLGSRC